MFCDHTMSIDAVMWYVVREKMKKDLEPLVHFTGLKLDSKRNWDEINWLNRFEFKKLVLNDVKLIWDNIVTKYLNTSWYIFWYQEIV